jgi:hypothetical protein
MKAMLGIFLYSYPQLAKMLCLSYCVFVFSSTKLEIRAEQNRLCLEVRGIGEKMPK